MSICTGLPSVSLVGQRKWPSYLFSVCWNWSVTLISLQLWYYRERYSSRIWNGWGCNPSVTEVNKINYCVSKADILLSTISSEERGKSIANHCWWFFILHFTVFIWSVHHSHKTRNGSVRGNGVYIYKLHKYNAMF